MWCLPDINRLNANAEAFKATLTHIITTGQGEHEEPLNCNYAGDDCEGEVRATPYYDIFGDLPKGHLDLCERHYGYYGLPDEGFFECEGCNWVFVENYTWEYYYHDDENGRLCLNCYREEVLADDDNWLQLTPENLASFDFTTVRKAKHLIAVGQGVPKELRFIDNVEFDSMSGGRVRTSSHADSTPNAGVEELRGLLRGIAIDGAKRAILILDGAYQFSISVGVYMDTEADRCSGAQPGPAEKLLREENK